MVPALQQAEADLQRYKDENRFRFAQLEAKDRESERAMHVASGIERAYLSRWHQDLLESG